MINTPPTFKLQEFIAHATEVKCITVGLSQKLVATGGADCKINIWDVQSGNNLRTLGSNKSTIESLCFSPSEQCIVSGSASGSIKVFDLAEGRYRNLGAHKTGVTSVQYHPFSDFVASGSLDTSVKVWDIRNKECVSTYSGHEQAVTCVRFSPEGDWVASAGKDGLILIFDMVAGKHLQTLRLSPAYVHTFEFHPLERVLGAATSLRTVRLWDLDRMEVLATTPPEPSVVRSLGFCTGSYAGRADSPYLCTATRDHVKLWSWSAGSSGVTVDQVGQLPLGAQGAAMTAMAVDSTSGRITGGSFISNFASIYQTSTAELMDNFTQLQSAAAATAAAAEERPPARPADRPPFQLYGSPAPTVPAHAGAGDCKAAPSAVAAATAAAAAALPDRRGMQQQQQPQQPQQPQQHAESAGPARDPRLPPKRAEAKSASPNAGPGAGAGARGAAKDAYAAVGVGEADSHPQSRHSRLYNPSYDDLEKMSGPSHGHGGEYDASPAPPYHGGHQVQGQAGAEPYNPSPSPAVNGGIIRANSSRKTAAAAPSDPFSEAEIAEPKPRGAAKAAAAGLFSPLVDQASKNYAAGPPSPTFSPPTVRRNDSHAQRTDEAPAAAAGRAQSSSSSSSSSADVASSALGQGKVKDDRISAALDRRDAVQALSNRLPPTRYPPPAAQLPLPTAAPLRPSTSGGAESADAVRVGAAPQAAAADAAASSSAASALAHISEAVRGSRDFSSVLSQRLVAMRTLRKMWEKGDLDGVLDYLCTVQESAKHDSLQLVVLADFFCSVELQGNGLCLDSCTRLFPLLDSILATSTHSRTLHGSGTLAPASEHITQSVVKALLALVGAFGEVIRGACSSAKQAGPHAGVDLQRDERLGKCKVCYQSILHLRQRISNMGLQHRGNARLREDMREFLDVAKAF